MQTFIEFQATFSGDRALSIMDRLSPIVPLTVHDFPSLEVQEGPFTSTVTNEANFSSLFLLSENVYNYKIGTNMFYFVCRTLLVVFCFEKLYFFSTLQSTCIFRLPNLADLKKCKH